MAANFKSLQREFELTVQDEPLRNQEECGELYEYLKATIMANADQVLGRSRGVRPITPRISDETRASLEAYESLSKHQDALKFLNGTSIDEE